MPANSEDDEELLILRGLLGQSLRLVSLSRDSIGTVSSITVETEDGRWLCLWAFGYNGSGAYIAVADETHLLTEDAL